MKKNFLYNLLLTGVNLLAPVITFPYASRALGPVGIGSVQFTLSLCQYVALIAAIGVPTYGARAVAKVRGDEAALRAVVSRLWTVHAVCSLVAFAVFASMALAVPHFAGQRAQTLAGGALVLLSFTGVDWVYTGLEQFRRLALTSALVKLLSLVCILLFVRDASDRMPYLLASLLAMLGANGANMLGVRRYLRFEMPRAWLAAHWRPLLVIFSSALATTFYTLFDTVMLGFLAGDAAVGLYAAASKLAKVCVPFILTYGAVLLPGITQSIERGDEVRAHALLNQSFAFIMFTSVPASVALLVFAKPLMLLFSGPEFLAGVAGMQIMACLPVLIGLGYFWGFQVLLPLHRDAALLRCTIVGMAVSLAANLILTPRYAHLGAAIAIVATEAVVTAAYYRCVPRSWSFRPSWRPVVAATLAAAPMLLCLLPAARRYVEQDHVHAIVAMLLAGAVYCAVQLWAFRNEWLRRALSIFGRASRNP